MDRCEVVIDPGVPYGWRRRERQVQSGSVPPNALVLREPDLAWSAGAPVPVLLASEGRTLFAFEHADETARIAEFVECVAVQFGFPDDETQHGHPLWSSRLTFYAAHELRESPWLAQLRLIESVHSQSLPQPFANCRHFVLTFHDSTIEAVARELVVLSQHDTVEGAIPHMVSMLPSL
jgi:hypothetical protein